MTKFWHMECNQKQNVPLLSYSLKRNKHVPPTPTLLFSFLAGEDAIRAGATILALEMKLHFENDRDILDLLAMNRENQFLLCCATGFGGLLVTVA